ncbi:hypothetical protein GCM10010129_46420 [Streptomyces fumigatiscleroticus]|nr:hypothetical protein GCM10010129_46420 [Streptomyces fumigatiscleroticus]
MRVTRAVRGAVPAVRWWRAGGWPGLLLGLGLTLVLTGVGPARAPVPVAAETVSVRAGRDPTVPVLARLWPVGSRPAVLRGWEPPATRYGRGHRGVDLAAPPGTAVRAVAPGRVSFAGRVAGEGVVSVELAGTGAPPLRTTYEPVRALVDEGEEVAPGEVVGTVERTGFHCSAPCLHWGLRRAEAYLDPLALLPPRLLHSGPSRLLPVLGVPLPARPTITGTAPATLDRTAPEEP